jgi:hypothetical protein
MAAVVVAAVVVAGFVVVVAAGAVVVAVAGLVVIVADGVVVLEEQPITNNEAIKTTAIKNSMSFVENHFFLKLTPLFLLFP